MKDYRLQGNSQEFFDVVKSRHEDLRRTLETTLVCECCGKKPHWFYVYTDTLICCHCLARYGTDLPVRFDSGDTRRVTCKCGDIRKRVEPTRFTCRRCGLRNRWDDPIWVQPLFEPLELEGRVEILTGRKLKKVLEEGLDA